MLIELHGGNFRNKGALKMLITTKKMLEAKYPQARFVADASVGTDEELESLGIEKLYIRRNWMGSRYFRPKFAIQRLVADFDRKFPNLFKDKLTLNKVDAIVDIAGFAYTDQWGFKPTQDFSSLSQWYKNNGKKVILLPQAFGSFTSSQIKQAIEKVIDNADMINARDASSYDNLNNIKSSHNVYQNSDITLFENYKTDNRATLKHSKVAIIPNMRMLDRGGDFWKSNYINSLDNIIKVCEELEVEPIMVIHDHSGEDKKIHTLINSKIKCQSITDPWELKEYLSNCRFVVGSRFHGLVAALSTGVPVLSLGWSHKYKELLNDFNVSKYLIDEKNNSKNEMHDLISELSEIEKNNEIRRVIMEEFMKKKNKNKQMWEKVFSILEK